MRITLPSRCFAPALVVTGGLFGCMQGGDEVDSTIDPVESTLTGTEVTEPTVEVTEPAATTAPGAAKRPGDPCIPSDVLLEGAPEGAQCSTATSFPYGYWSWPCTSDEDCGEGNQCSPGEECVRPCSDDSECKAPMTCVKQVGDAEREIPTCLCLAEECQDPGEGPQPAVDAAE